MLDKLMSLENNIHISYYTAGDTALKKGTDLPDTGRTQNRKIRKNQRYLNW